MASMILVPLDDTVVFPTMDVTLPVDVGDEDRVLLIPRHDNEFAKVGTIAEVTDRVRLPGGARAVQLSGVDRGVAGAAQSDQFGHLRIEVTESVDDVPVDGRTRELEREYRAVVEEILELRGVDDRVGAWLRAIGEPGPLADTERAVHSALRMARQTWHQEGQNKQHYAHGDDDPDGHADPHTLLTPFGKPVCETHRRWRSRTRCSRGRQGAETHGRCGLR